MSTTTSIDSITVRKAEERGSTRLSWLNSRHSFSFNRFSDPDWNGFRALRVINDDWIKAGAGFGTHPHSDMEIISYAVSGALKHQDSTGSGEVAHRGDVQRMTAGSGITHSEFNPSDSEDTHFLQIWVLPEEQGLVPEYEMARFSDEEKRDTLRLIVSRDDREGSLKIHQDAELYSSLLSPGAEVRHALADGRHAWLQVAGGKVELNGTELESGDGAAVSHERQLVVRGVDDAELLLFDLG